jgi:hypothetical protein
MLLPACGISIRYVLLADGILEDRIEQALPRADMPIERGRTGIKPIGDRPHSQAVKTGFVEDPDRRGHDRLAVQRIARIGGGAAWHPVPH